MIDRTKEVGHLWAIAENQGLDKRGYMIGVTKEVGHLWAIAENQGLDKRGYMIGVTKEVGHLWAIDHQERSTVDGCCFWWHWSKG